MFKNLKKKLEQGVNQSPLKGALASASRFLEDKDKAHENAPLAESTPKKSGDMVGFEDGNQTSSSKLSNYLAANQSLDSSPAIIPVGQLIDIPLQDTSSESYSGSMAGNVTPRASRSRTSSISSVTSDSSFFTNVSFPQLHYTLPSDMESEMEQSGTDLHTVTKEDLFHYIQKYQQRATRYKSKFIELITAYKDLLQERDKFKNTLTQSQDRAFRRISELKEQIQLDQKAKHDLEENYNFVIEEKGEFIKVLQTQVQLLKDGKNIPADLQERIHEGKLKNQDDVEKFQEQQTELNSLKEKVKHQEGLLQKCKEIIKTNKEKFTQLAEEKSNLEKMLADTKMELSQIKGPTSPDTLTKLQNQIKQARQVIEQLETDREIAIAEVKQQVHQEMETKDQELIDIRAQMLAMKEENTDLTDKVSKLEKAAAEQLEKSRDIIKRLKEEKSKILQEMESKMQERDDQMELEKEKLMHEIACKSTAIAVMQEQMDKLTEDKVNEAVRCRDEVCQRKMSEQEMEHNSFVMVKENEMKLLQSRLEEEIQKQTVGKENDLRKLQDENRIMLQEKTELETLVNQMQTEADIQMRDFNKKLDDQKEKARIQISELMIDHERYVAEILTQHEKSIQEKTEELLEKHARQMDDLNRQHDEEKQMSYVELGKYYQEEIQKVKSGLETLLQEKSQQMESLTVTIQQLKTDLSMKEQELEQRSVEFKTKMEETNTNYKERIYECDKLHTELNKVRNDYESNKAQMENELSELRQNVVSIAETKDIKEAQIAEMTQQVSDLHDQLSAVNEARSRFEAENTELKQQLQRLTREVDEKYESADSTVKNLLQQVNDLERQKMEFAQERQKLNDDSVDLQEKIKGFSLNLTDAEEEIVKQKEKISILITEIESFKTDNLSSVAEIEHLKIALNDKDKAINELKKCFELQEKNYSNEMMTKDAIFTEKFNEFENYKLIQSEEKKALEESFKIQFEEKLNKFKDNIKKMKETFEEKLKEKDDIFETKLKDLNEQKESLAQQLGSHFQQQMDDVIERHRKDMAHGTEVFESNINGMKVEHQQQIEIYDGKLKHLTTVVDALKESFEKEKIDLTGNFNNNETSLRKEFEQQSDAINLQLQYTELRVKDLEKVCTEYERQNEDLKSQLLELEKDLTDKGAEFSTSSESLNQQLLNVSEIHNQEMEEKNLTIVDLTARLTDLMNTNASFEEMLKEVNSQCQLKDDQLLKLKEDYENQLLIIKAEHMKNIDIMETNIEKLRGCCDELKVKLVEKEQEKNTGKQDHDAQIQIIQDGYEKRLTEMSHIDEQLHCQLHVLTEKVSETEKKLQDCIESYEEKLEQYKVISERQGRALSEEKEILALQLIDMTQQAQQKTEDLKETLKKALDDCEHLRETNIVLVDNNQCFKGEVEELKTQLDDLCKQLHESCTLLDTKENTISELRSVIGKKDAQISLLEQNSKEMEICKSSLENLEMSWQGKMKEMKQKFVTKLKEVQSQSEEKVKLAEEALRSEREASTEKLSLLKEELTIETKQKEDVSSELSHANTKLLQLEQSKETIQEMEQNILSLQENIKEKNLTLLKLQSDKDELLLSLNNYKDLLTSKETEFSNFKQQLIAIKTDHQTVCDQNKTLTENALMLEECLTKKNDELSQFQLNYEEMVTKFQVQIKDLNAEGEINRTDLQHTSDSFEKYKQDLRCEVNQLETNLQVKVDEIEKIKLALLNSEKQVTELSNEKSVLEKALKERIEEQEYQYKEKVVILQKSGVELLSVSEKRIAELLSEIENLKQELDIKNSQHVTFESNIKILLEQKEALQSEITSLQEHENDVKESQQLETEKLRQTLESETAEKVAEFKKKAELYISQVKKQVKSEKESSLKSLQDTLSEKEKELSELKSLNADLSDKVSNLTETCDKNGKELHNLRNELNVILENKNMFTQEQIQKSQETQDVIEQLRGTMESMKAEKEEMNHNLKSISQEKSEIETQFSTIKASFENERKQLEEEYQCMKIQKDEELEQLDKKLASETAKFEMTLLDKENEYTSKIKQLVKDFNQQMMEKEKEFELQFSEVIDRSNHEDSQKEKESTELLAEAQRDIYERDERLEELKLEYGSKLKEKDAMLKQMITDHKIMLDEAEKHHQMEIIELQNKMQQMQEEMLLEKEQLHKMEVDTLTQEWHMEKKSVPTLSALPRSLPNSHQELLHNNQMTMNAIQSSLNSGDVGHTLIAITKQMEDLKEKHRLEIAELKAQQDMYSAYLPQPLLATPDMRDAPCLELELTNLQMQLSQLHGELARTKQREKELYAKIEEYQHYNSYNHTPTSPGYYSDGTPTGPLLTEPTQLEYLRNVLYMYMMGKQTKTLTKVIGTVVQFTEDQMKQLLAKEEKSGNWLLNPKP